MSDFRKYNEPPRPQDFKCYEVDDGGETHWFVATTAGYALAAFAQYMTDSGIEGDMDEFPEFTKVTEKRLGEMVYNEDDGKERPMREVFNEVVAACVKDGKEHEFLASTVY